MSSKLRPRTKEARDGTLGRPITFVDIPSEAMREALLGFGMLVWQADGLIEDYAHYRRGEAQDIASGIQDAMSPASRSFEISPAITHRCFRDA